MKKAVAVVSCALLCAPVFAKGFIEHMTQVKKHKFVQSSSNHVDFSGHWVGHCGTGDDVDTITLDLKQNADKLSVSMHYADLPDAFTVAEDFIFNAVKLNNNSSPSQLESSMSYADWIDGNSVDLEFHGNQFLALDNASSYNYRIETWSAFAMSLDGDVLTLSTPTLDDEDASCDFHKEG